MTSSAVRIRDATKVDIVTNTRETFDGCFHLWYNFSGLKYKIRDTSRIY